MFGSTPFASEAAPKKRGIFLDIVQSIVIALGISVLIYLVFAIPSQVDGQSMEPNFHDKELLLTDKTVQWLGNTQIGEKLGIDYKRGDVVVFSHGDISLIKRIIATAGDTVRITGDHVYVNGKMLKEAYIPDATRTRVPFESLASLQDNETVRVPENSFFVMGDNRENSKDSRFAEVGFVPRDLLKGRVFLRFLPLTAFGIIRRGEYTEVDDTSVSSTPSP